MKLIGEMKNKGRLGMLLLTDYEFITFYEFVDKVFDIWVPLWAAAIVTVFVTAGVLCWMRKIQP